MIKQSELNAELIKNPGRSYEIIDAICWNNLANTTIHADNFLEDSDKNISCDVSYFKPVCCSDTEESEVEIIKPSKENLTLDKVLSRVYVVKKEDILQDENGFSFSDVAIKIISSVRPSFRMSVANYIQNQLLSKIVAQPDGLLSRFISTYNGVTPIPIWEIERIYQDAGFLHPYIITSDPKNYALREAHRKELLPVKIFYYIQIGEQDPQNHTTVTFDPQSIRFISSVRESLLKITDYVGEDKLSLEYGLYIGRDKELDRWLIQYQLHCKLFSIADSVFHFKSCRFD